MGVGNLLLLTQATSYVITLILGLCLIAPLCCHHVNFKGNCLLFTTGSWRETDGQLIVDWANSAYCNISIFVGCLLVAISIIQFFRMARLLFRGIDSSFLSAFVDTLVGSFCMLLIFFVSVMITVGLEAWCDTMTLRFSSCQEATMTDINKNITSSQFFVQMGMALFSAWAGWVIWVGVTVLAIVKVCKYYQEENVMVSMARERQRLINENIQPKELIS